MAPALVISAILIAAFAVLTLGGFALRPALIGWAATRTEADIVHTGLGLALLIMAGVLTCVTLPPAVFLT